MSVGVGPVRAYGWRALLLYSGVRAAWWLLTVAASHPRATAVIFGGSVVVWQVASHPLRSAVVLSLVVELCATVASARPAVFRRFVALPLLARWRAAFVYRRLWVRAMRAADLERTDPDGTLRRPRLVGVRCAETADVVRVRGLLGQRFGEWEAAGPMLAHTFGAAGVVVHRGDDRRLTLELVRARRGRSWNRGALDYSEPLV